MGLLREAKDRFDWLRFTQRGRIWLCGILVGALFLYVGRKLEKVQLHPNESSVSTPQDYRTVLRARRGSILDRNGRTLAVSYPLWLVYVDSDAVPSDPKEREEIFRALASFGIEGCDGAKIYEALRVRQGHYSPLGRTADRDVERAIRTNALLRRCVGADDVANRIYPAGRSFCHVVGFSNSNDEPQMGVELSMDRVLRGTDGFIVGRKTVRGREIREMRKDSAPPTDGCDVTLALDEDLQDLVGQALDRVVEERHPAGAWAIVQDPRTGEILAMASRPDFDPAEWGKFPPELQRNLAIFHQYEPGSVMKSVAVSGALNEGLTRTTEVFDCRPRLYAGRKLEDHLPKDKKTWREISDLSLPDVLAYSSNRGASQLAERLGKERMEKYLRAFGCGVRTGIPLAGEATGSLGMAPGRPWSDLQGLRVAIGQGVAVTGIQLVSIYSAIANGGRLMKPILVKRVTDPSGRVVAENRPEIVGRPVSREVADQVREMLVGTTRYGTGKEARIDGYEVAGKTGTSEIAVRGGYAPNRRCASFVGFFPAEDPCLTILVTVFDLDEKPWSGGAVAAPVFAEIAAGAAALEKLPADPEIFGPPPILPGEDFDEGIEEADADWFDLLVPEENPGP